MDERAIEYAKRCGFSLDLTKKLGYGTDGTVWRTNRNTAIKALERQATYRTEKRCYLCDFETERLAKFSASRYRNWSVSTNK
jgi:hypothetical protein